MCSNGYEKRPGVPNIGIISVANDMCRQYGSDSWICRLYSYSFPNILGTVVVDDVEQFCQNGPVPAPGGLNAADAATIIGGGLKAAQWAQHNQFPIWCQCKPGGGSPPGPGQPAPDDFDATAYGGVRIRYYSANNERMIERTVRAYRVVESDRSYPYLLKGERCSEPPGTNSTLSGLATQDGSIEILYYGACNGEENPPPEIEDEDPPPPEIPPDLPDEDPPIDFPPDGPSSSGCPQITLNPIQFLDEGEPPRWEITKTSPCNFSLDLFLSSMAACDLTEVLSLLNEIKDYVDGVDDEGEPDPPPPDDGPDDGSEEESWPVELPALLTQDDGAVESIANLPQAIVWLAKNLDALSGQYPIKLEIEDTDPITRGNQSETIDLPNQAEAMAELFGLAYEANTNSELAVNMLFRLIPEVIAAKNSSLTAQDYSQAISNWLGFRVKNVEREIDSNFNPLSPNSLTDFLSASKYKIQGVEDDDPHTLVEWIQQIKYATAIVKASVFRGAGQESNLTEEIQSVTDNQSADSGEAWEKFVDALNRAESNLTDRSVAPRPRATSVDDVLNPGTILPDRDPEETN